MRVLKRKFAGRLSLLLSVLVVLPAAGAMAESAGSLSFDATFVDAGGLRTEVTSVVFYWEEQLSETQLALHELTHVPAKRGRVPIQIQFGKIKQIEFKPPTDHAGPVLSITLKNGKTGEFSLDIPGSFKGHTDFGEMIAKPTHLQQIIFK